MELTDHVLEAPETKFCTQGQLALQVPSSPQVQTAPLVNLPPQEPSPQQISSSPQMSFPPQFQPTQLGCPQRQAELMQNYLCAVAAVQQSLLAQHSLVAQPALAAQQSLVVQQAVAAVALTAEQQQQQQQRSSSCEIKYHACMGHKPHSQALRMTTLPKVVAGHIKHSTQNVLQKCHIPCQPRFSWTCHSFENLPHIKLEFTGFIVQPCPLGTRI